MKNWEVRNMGEADCDAAAAAAKRVGKTIAEWLGEAIRAKVNEGRQPVAIEVADQKNGHSTDWDRLFQTASTPTVLKWLHREAGRRVAAELGIDPPKARPGPARRLAAPEGQDGARVGEGIQLDRAARMVDP